MNDYQLEQFDALSQLQAAMATLSATQRRLIQDEMQAYVDFRRAVDRFTERFFSPFCTNTCFQSNTSACCSKDGIITFWADMVVNAFNSSPRQLSRVVQAIKTPAYRHKCIYLTPEGCLWSVRPLVCAFFLCDRVCQTMLDENPSAMKSWRRYEAMAKAYRWPDKPVLFDRLEAVFIDLGCDSALMYMHKSPGLLHLKKRAGLV